MPSVSFNTDFMIPMDFTCNFCYLASVLHSSEWWISSILNSGNNQNAFQSVYWFNYDWFFHWKHADWTAILFMSKSKELHLWAWAHKSNGIWWENRNSFRIDQSSCFSLGQFLFPSHFIKWFFFSLKLLISMLSSFVAIRSLLFESARNIRKKNQVPSVFLIFAQFWVEQFLSRFVFLSCEMPTALNSFGNKSFGKHWWFCVRRASL